MNSLKFRYAGITALLFALVFVAGCGETSSSSTAGGNSPTPAPSVAATSVPDSAVTSPTKVSATSTVAVVPTRAGSLESDEPSDEDILARGRLIFEKTAGGVGCAMCHGLNALGDPAQGVPPNIGASVEMIEQALFDRPQMSFMSVTRDEVIAVSVYLQWLKEQQ